MVKLRSITPDDFENLFSFWKENYTVTAMDSKEHFIEFLEKNRDLSILAEDDGKIVGSALGSYDGRRGYLQKVVIHKKVRKKGIGKLLVNEATRRLVAVGALYIPVSVDEELLPFYEKCGFVKNDSASMGMSL